MIQLQQLTQPPRSTINSVAEVLVQAFQDDPGMGYLCQQNQAGYTTRLQGWFRSMLRLQLTNRQPVFALLMEDNYVGAAVVTNPQPHLKPLSLLHWLWQSLYASGIVSIRHTLDHIQQSASQYPGSPHLRLDFLAVHPAKQGKSYSRILLEAVHQHAAAHPESTGVWLETANPTNVPLYEHFGYRVSGGIPMGHLTTVTLFRANR
jgi:ribosomal protein S18 acetylase RimI-like enzyme